MALVTRAADASVDASTAMLAPQIPDLIAGEDLEIGPCYIKASDGKAYASNGTADNAAAKCNGFNVRAGVKAGQPVTLFGPGTRMRYATGMTPGATLYVGATAGRLDTGATTGDAVGIAFVKDATDIVVARYAI